MSFSERDGMAGQSGVGRGGMRRWLVQVRRKAGPVKWVLAAVCLIALGVLGYTASRDKSRPVTAAELPPAVVAPVAPVEPVRGKKSVAESAPVGAAAAVPESSARLQVLSGKTGRPVVGAHVLMTGEDGRGLDGKKAAEQVTDVEGYVPISDAAAGRTVHAVVKSYKPCSKRGVSSFSLQTTRATGVVSENSCKPRITIYKQPGTLVYFVRPEGLLEKMAK